MIPIELNHIYFVVDRETYDAIRKSEFVQSLVSTYEQKNSADNQAGWEGFYLRGKNTYVEIFYPQERYPYTGISGIGMGVDEPGGIDRIAYELKDSWQGLQKGQFARNGKPWFDYLAVKDSYFAGKNSFWIMEYASSYFSENSQDVSRAHYNERKYDPTKPLVNIVEFSIALPKEGLETLSSYFRNCGLQAEEQSYMTSEKITIHLTEENESRKGIYEIHFSLDRDFEEVSSQIGNSVLQLSGKVGVWTFVIQ
jgi:hypothetical protein